jgi:hypothetical protein
VDYVTSRTSQLRSRILQGAPRTTPYMHSVTWQLLTDIPRDLINVTMPFQLISLRNNAAQANIDYACSVPQTYELQPLLKSHNRGLYLQVSPGESTTNI